MGRLLISTVFAVAIMATAPVRAYADEQWCETDPVFIVNNVPIRVTAGLTIDPIRVVTVYYEMHVAADAVVSVVATTSPRIPETVQVYADLPAGSSIVWLATTVVTTDVADRIATQVTIYGPTAQQPDAYAGVTNDPLVISISLN